MDGRIAVAVGFIIFMSVFVVIGIAILFGPPISQNIKTVYINGTVTETQNVTKTVSTTTVTQTKIFEPDDYDWSQNVTVPPMNQTTP